MSVETLTVARGAAAGVLLAVPAALANVVLSAQEDRSVLWSLVTLIVLAVGFLLAGFVAGSLASTEPTRHGTVAALVLFVLVEVIAIGGRLDRGDGLSVGSILFTGFLAAVAGTSAGTFAARRRPVVTEGA